MGINVSLNMCPTESSSEAFQPLIRFSTEEDYVSGNNTPSGGDSGEPSSEEPQALNYTILENEDSISSSSGKPDSTKTMMKREASISSDKSTPSSIKIDNVVIRQQSKTQENIPVPNIIMTLPLLNQEYTTDGYYKITNMNVSLPKFGSDPRGENEPNQSTQPGDGTIAQRKDNQNFLLHEDQNKLRKIDTTEASSSKNPRIDDKSKVVESSVTPMSGTKDEYVTITITVRAKKSDLNQYERLDEEMTTPSGGSTPTPSSSVATGDHAAENVME